MKKKLKVGPYLVLALILLMSGYLRFVNLGSLPPGTNSDEISIGYNAYAIKTAGIDEWGNKYPLMFKAFGEYKMPGLPYLLAFLLNFIPLSVALIRLPSAISGFLSIVATFFIIKELFPKRNWLPVFAANFLKVMLPMVCFYLVFFF